MSETQTNKINAFSRTLNHALWEFKLNVRNGEQILLLIVIPLIVLFTLTRTAVIGGEQWSVPQALSVSLSISIIAAGFTSLAISTAFERRSGTLLAMGVTPLTRIELVLGKGISIFLLAAVSAVVLASASIILGWRPELLALTALPIMLLGILSVSGIAFLLAGTCRAELVLALANGIFVIAMIFGGIIFQFEGFLQFVTNLFPPAAIYELLTGAIGGARETVDSYLLPLLVLSIWAVAGNLIAARLFRWR